MPAGFLGFRPTVSAGGSGVAPGVWNLREVFDQRRSSLWPEATPVGLVPNSDSKARFYLHSTASTFELSANTTTGYYKITHNGSSIIAQEHPYHTYPTYYRNTVTSIGGQPGQIVNNPKFTSVNTGAVVVLESCNSSGTTSGNIQGIDISKSGNKVKEVDLSGCTALTNFNAGATGGTPSNRSKPFSGSYGNRYMASLIEEVRAVGVGASVNGQSAQYYSPTWTPAVYVYQGGIDLWNQQLDAASLNQLYTDLGATSTSSPSSLMVGSNPGIGSDNPSLASGYTVYGS
tara:strand:- start:25159 stop:26022 length:864 start_codon:yes stop_codon:yes gene_type:complete